MSERVAVGDGLGAQSPRAPVQAMPARSTVGSALAVLAVVVGEAVLILAGVLPVWGSRLEAPQYPKGLSLWVFGNRTEGDVTEINGLNHYIGMRAIDVSTVPELALWPWALVAAGALLVVAVFQRGRIGRLAAAGMWLIPIGILADIQRWLIVFGGELDPTAALRLEPFVPLVIGPSSVWNFTIWAYPGPALGLIGLVAATALVARRAALPAPRTRLVVGAAAVAGLALGVYLFVPRVDMEPPREGSRGPTSGAADLGQLVRDAPAGTTIVVPAGLYHVHLVVDRPLTLVADGEVILDGSGRGTVVLIRADDVTVRGFRIENTGGQVEEAAGVRVEGDRVSLEGNRIANAFTAIAAFSVSDLRLLDNEVAGSMQLPGADLDDHLAPAPGGGSSAPDPVSSPVVGSSGVAPSAAPAEPHADHGAGAGPRGQGDAISLWNVRRALIRGNQITGARDGVYLNYVDDVLLDTNTIRSSRYAVHSMFGSELVAFENHLVGNLSGFVLMYTETIQLGRNLVLDHRSPATGFGIALKDVRGVQLIENVVAGNRTGLQVEGTEDTGAAPAIALRNRFSANDVGVALMATADLTFGANTFEENISQVIALEPGVERRNHWTYHGTGNAWSDYAGYDLAGDGIGDVPYVSSAAAQVLLEDAPALIAYRTSPALQLLDVAQVLWEAGRQPVVRDMLPLTSDVAPAFPRPPGNAGSMAPWLLAGLLSLLPAAAVMAEAMPGLRGRQRPWGRFPAQPG